MAYTNRPGTINDRPATMGDRPASINDRPAAMVLRPDVPSGGGGNHLLDGSGNILAVTVGVDQLTNA